MKQALIGVVIGIFIAVTAYHAYVVYQLRSQVIQNTSAIYEVVGFINFNVEKKDSINVQNEIENN